MEYADAAWERAMLLQEVMLKAIGGELHWFRAAEILGMSPRSLRAGGSAMSGKAMAGCRPSAGRAVPAPRPAGRRGAGAAPLSRAVPGIQCMPLS
jgi:hypothetical protein